MKQDQLKAYCNLVRPYTLANKSYSKVFGIGANKTCTTTLELILKSLGLKMPIQTEQEILLVKQLQNGNFTPLIDLVNKFDAFQDQPFSSDLTFSQVDALFPNSKFILTIREPEEWFASRIKFDLKRLGLSSVKELNESFFKNKLSYLYENYEYENLRRQALTVEENKVYENWDNIWDKKNAIERYKQRNKLIIKYFAFRQNQLLVIDLSKENDTSKILKFLNIPTIFKTKIPHLNSSSI